MKKLYTSFLLIFFFFTSSGAYYYEFTPLATEAYQMALSLRFQESEQLIHQIKREEPNNLMVHFIENYIDFLTVFINEDKSEFKNLERNKSNRLKMLRKGDKNSPYYLYCQAEVKLQWALARIKFEQYFTAFNEVSSAYKLLNRNRKKFPDFVANNKSLGILHALVGTVPDNYKWGVKLLGGMSGTIQQGKKEIEETLIYAQNNPFIFEEETLVMYAFLMLHLKNDMNSAWEIVQSQRAKTSKNPLICFAIANIAMRTGRNDEAIKIINEKPTGSQYATFYYLDYMLGLAKLYRLDKDADIYLKKYVDNFYGQNYIKEAYQKLAWHYLVQGSMTKYKAYIGFCKSQGAKIIGGDKNAEKEAKSREIPNKELLKARLLFDGGYFQRAYGVLKHKSKNDFSTQKDQLELTYRLGRITHRMDKTKEALSFYQKTINEGSKASYYYACNAALQMGLIYEASDQFAKAKSAYQNCLDINPDEYRSSLHQKAKAGLNRLKK